jgi:hypothetical protein
MRKERGNREATLSIAGGTQREKNNAAVVGKPRGESTVGQRKPRRKYCCAETIMGKAKSARLKRNREEKKKEEKKEEEERKENGDRAKRKTLDGHRGGSSGACR